MGFEKSAITRFLARFPTEDKYIICSLESQLQINIIRSVEIPDRTRDIKLLIHVSTSSLNEVQNPVTKHTTGRRILPSPTLNEARDGKSWTA